MLRTKNIFSPREKKNVIHVEKSARMGSHQAAQPTIKLNSGTKGVHLGGEAWISRTETMGEG